MTTPSTTVTGQLGNMIPLTGDLEIRQESTAADLLQIVLSSAASTAGGAAGLVVQRGGSTAGERIFGVEYDGVMGMRKVINISTASCGITMAASQSGAFCVVGDNTGTDTVITLPAQAEGMWFEFYQAGGVKSSGTSIKSATGDIIVASKDLDLDLVQLGQATGTAIGNCARVISNGTNWFLTFYPAVSSAKSDTAGMGQPAVTD